MPTSTRSRRPHCAAMRHSLRHSLLIASLGLGSSLLGSANLALADESQRQHFEIASGPLDRALNQFASDAGILLVIDARLTEGKHSAGLQGDHDIETALVRLLEGSGLHSLRQGNRYTLARNDEALSLDGISVTDERREEDNIYKTPDAVFHIDRERLDRVPYSSPGDILKGIPGVTVGNVRNGVGIEPNVRGMQGMGRVKVIVDGTEAVSSAYKGYGGNKDNSFIDPDFLATIDVEKGPSSTSGAIGGTLRMQTLGIADLLTDPEKNWGIQLKGMYGNNSSDDLERVDYCDVTSNPNNPNSLNTLRYDACMAGRTYTNPNNGLVYDDRRSNDSGRYPDNNSSGSIIGAWQPSDRLEVVAGHSHRWSGNYSSGKKGSATYTDYTSGDVTNISSKRPGEKVLSHQDTETLLFKSKLHLSGDQNIEFIYNHYRSTFGELRDTSYCTAVGNMSDCFPKPSETNQKRYSLTHNWQPATPWLALKTDLWLVDTDEVRGSNDQENSVRTLGFRTHNKSTIDLPWLALRTHYGLQWSKEKTDSAATANGVADPGSFGYAGRGDPKGRTEQQALFANLELPVQSWLTLHGGLRQDRFEMKKDSKEQRHSSYSSPVTDDKASQISANYGLTVTPYQGIQVYARYAEGFRAPSLRENLLISATQSTEGLKPETSENRELGLNLSFQQLLTNHDTLGLKLSQFDNKYKNYIYGNGYMPAFANIPEANLRGQELSINYDAGWLFAEYALTHYQKVEACFHMFNASYAPLECYNGVDPSGMGPLAMPEQSQYLTTGLRLLDQNLVLGINVNKASDALMSFDEINRVFWQEYTIYDLFAHYQVNKHLRLGVSVENLRDTFYLEAGTTTINIPSPGRTARGTVTLKF